MRTDSLLCDQPRLMAAYNRWMNERLYTLVESLPAEKIHEQTGAFFGSMFGTLNHLCATDIIWLRRLLHGQPGEFGARLAALPLPTSLDAPLVPGLAALSEMRRRLDALIEDWVASLTPDALAATVTYHNMRGQAFRRTQFHLLMHWFNHQTHHRGQLTTMLSQAGVEVGVTDLLALLPEQPSG